MTDKAVAVSMDASRSANRVTGAFARPPATWLALALVGLGLLGLLFWKADRNSALGLAALTAVVASLFARLWYSREAALAAGASMRESEFRFQNLSALSVDWYWEQDEELRFVLLSSEVHAKSGTPASTRIGLRRWELPGLDLQSADWDAHRAVCRAHQPFRDFAYRRVNETGASRWNRVSGEPIFDDNGTFKGYRGVTSDITSEKQGETEILRAQQALAASDEKFQQLAANIPGILWTAAPTGLITYVSTGYERVMGRSAQRLLAHGGDWIRAVLPADRKGLLGELRAARDGHLDHEFRISRADGVSWIHNRSFPVHDQNGKIVLITGIAEDITARKDSEELLRYMARYDQLTGLPNRVLFYDHLQRALTQSQRSRRPVGLVFADLDHFKRINDTLGHTVGDQLLQEVAQRLQGALRSADIVARLSGDEFAVILTELGSPEDAGLVTKGLLRMLDPPFMLEGQEVFVTASAGISIFPTDGDAPSALLKNADVAMYRAKEAGRNTFRYFEPDMNARSLERMSMDSQLRRALERGEFLLHYQPKVDLRSGAITGLEALLRWQHPERGLVSPAQFIPILEDNGLIVPVGEWVLEEACRQATEWSIEDWVPELTIAVNLSGRQLQGQDPGARIRRTVADSRVDARLIELEITETVLMRNAEKTGAILNSFKEQGMRLSVDDFGTGYSSLAYLKSFPLDALKIDRSFVRDITTDAGDALITRAVISLAHSLNLKVVAEGVETQAQRGFLTASGCDEMQGYLFSWPLAAVDCANLLRQQRRLEPLQRSVSSKPTLLVVDDEPGIVSLLARTLRHESYDVLSAETAERALELLAVNPVSVVLTDHRMPGMSGVELLRRIKVLYPDTVRLVMSGDADAQAVTEAINQGAVYKFIVKPWDHQELRSTLRQAFAHKALLDQNRDLSLLVRELRVV